MSEQTKLTPEQEMIKTIVFTLRETLQRVTEENEFLRHHILRIAPMNAYEIFNSVKSDMANYIANEEKAIKS